MNIILRTLLAYEQNYPDYNLFISSFPFMFVCFGFIVPLENFLLIWGRHDCLWRAANFDLCSTLLASESSLVCHTYCYSGIRPQWSPRTRDTHKYCCMFSSGTVTTCFYDLGLSRLGFEYPTFRMQGKRSNRLRHRHGSFHRGVLSK